MPAVGPTPHQARVPNVTVDALREAFRERGLAALDTPANKWRMSTLSVDQRAALLASIKRILANAAQA